MSLSIRLGGLAPLAVATLPDLKGLQLPQGIVHLLGLVTESDGLGGLFYWNETSTAVADDSTVVTPTDSAGAGRWLRVRTYDGPNSITYTVPVVPDGVTDNSTVLQDAIDRLYAAGGGILQIPPGRIKVSLALVMKDRVTIRGAGMGITIFVQTDPIQVFRRDGSGTAIDAEYMAFEDFTVEGTWLDNQSQNANCSHFHLINRVRSVRWTRVESLYCRWMAITAGYNDEVIVENCRFLYSARDGANLTGSNRCKVINSTFRHGFDDAIAIHQTSADGNPPNEQHIIANNIIEDMNGIKCFGIRKATIHHNVITRPKGYGVMISTGGVEGYSDALAVDISHNVITDPVNTNKFGGSAQQHGIHLASRANGFQAPVVGGGAPDYNYPEDFWGLSNAVGAQNAGGSGLKIHSNIIKWTLPHAANYSSWGFDTAAPALGRAFVSTGWEDPDMTSGHERTGTGIVLGGALLDVSIRNNEIYGSSIGIDAASITYLGNADVCGNKFARFAIAALNMETGGQKYGAVQFKGNYVDGDPYFESANRSTLGTWNSAASPPWPVAVDIVLFSAVEISGNTFRNLNVIAHFSGTFGATLLGNTYCMFPDAAFALSAHGNGAAGIRRPYGLDESTARLLWEVSDPTSATYGQIVFATSTMTALAMPTSNYYATGQVVWYDGVAVATQTLEAGLVDPTPQYTLIGWRRLTTGNAHVLNTDWRELRCLTGN